MVRETEVTYSFPFLGILALIFITLKLMGYITWSWLWVLAPIWGPFAFAIFIFMIVGLFALFSK